MSCLDKHGHNPLPMLIAFMPSVAAVVMDNCVTREGDIEDEDFTVTYNFKYLDPHPDSAVCRKGPKVWYCNVSTKCFRLYNIVNGPKLGARLFISCRGPVQL